MSSPPPPASPSRARAPARGEWLEAGRMTLLSLALVAGIVVLFWGLQYPWANDSVGYIQEAQGLFDGRGLTRATGWDVPDPAYAPFPLFPPGLSLAAAGVSLTGLSVAHAALAVSWFAWLLVVPATAWAVRPLAGVHAARAVGVLAGVSPAFVEWGFQALSDAPLTLFSVLSLGLVTRAPALADLPLRAWALSGLLAGVAYLFRNAGAVLPLTVIALLALALITQRLSFAASLRAGLAWGAGFALCAFPLFAYNFVTFGSIQPYFGAHGTIDYGLPGAVRVSLWSLWLDLFAWRFVAELAWNGPALAALAPLGLAAGWLILRRRQPAFPLAGGVLALYALIGCALVVWGRSRFDWVETSLTRQFMPYTWALLALGAWALQRLAPSRWPAVGGLVLAGLLAGRAHLLWQNWTQQTALRDSVRAYGYAETAARHPDAILTQRIRLDAAADAALVARIRALPADTHLVTLNGGILSVPAGRPLRPLAFDDVARLPALRARLGDRPLVLVALPGNARLRQPDAQRWQADVLASLGGAGEILYRTPLALMVRVR
ncbi:MAG: hypothetical protein ACK4R8_01470 [Thiobacillus sp.]